MISLTEAKNKHLTMEGMDISKEDGKKRGRSETSVSEADTILIDDSKDSKDANEINTNESKEISPKYVDKGATNAPKYIHKGKAQQKSQRNKWLSTYGL